MKKNENFDLIKSVLAIKIAKLGIDISDAVKVDDVSVLMPDPKLRLAVAVIFNEDDIEDLKLRVEEAKKMIKEDVRK